MQIQPNLGQGGVKINPACGICTGIGRDQLGSCSSRCGSSLLSFVTAALMMSSNSRFMEVQNTITGNAHELMISGRIDGEGANKLEEVILASMRNGATSIYVNLNGATFLCSAGL